MENNNPKSNQELEQIKWAISRIDLYHKLMIENIKSSKNIFENVGEKILRRVKDARTVIYSILGVALTILFGINSVNPIPENNFYIYLAIIFGVGVTTFIIFNLILSLFDKSFTLLSSISNDEMTMVANSQAHVATHFVNLLSMDLRVIENYYDFTQLLGIAIILYFADTIEKNTDKSIEWLKKELKSEIKKAKKYTEYIPAYYNRLDRSYLFPEESFNFMENSLKSYTKNLRKK